MGFWDNIQTQFTNNVNIYGAPVRIKHFNKVDDITDFDDVQTLIQSGADIWVSGLVLDMDGAKGADEASLLEQGKIIMTDKRIYLPGTLVTSEIMRIGIGSPTFKEYSVLPEGVQNEHEVYTKIFARKLVLGSLSGEI